MDEYELKIRIYKGLYNVDVQNKYLGNILTEKIYIIEYQHPNKNLYVHTQIISTHFLS